MRNDSRGPVSSSTTNKVPLVDFSGLGFFTEAPRLGPDLFASLPSQPGIVSTTKLFMPIFL
jgi:hypothetical protein